MASTGNTHDSGNAETGRNTRSARHLQLALAAVLAALALWAFAAVLQAVREAVAMRSAWVQVAAVVESTADEAWVELELSEHDAARLPRAPRPAQMHPRREGHTRLLVPSRPYTLIGHLEEIELALDPQRPGRALIVDVMADLSPTLAYLIFGTLLALAAWRVLTRLRWGHDELWQAGAWIAVASSSQRPGLLASEHGTVLSSHESQRAALFWTTVIALAALWAWPFAWLNRAQQPIEGGFAALASAALLALVLHTLISTRSRRVGHDAAGIADGTWFGTQRIPWSAIADWCLVNTQADAQRRHDQTQSSRRNAFRPRTLMAWIATDAAGNELLRLDEAMLPTPAFEALCQALKAHANAQGPTANALCDKDDEVSPAEAAAQERLRDEFERQQQAHHGFMRWAFVLVVAPFALMAAAAFWNALQYAVWADRISGTVVARHDGKLTSLTLAYVAADGKPRQLQTDGTAAYALVALGQKLPVRVRRDDFDAAKVDGFWAVWIWPVILGGLLLIVAVPLGIGFLRAPRRGNDAIRGPR